MRRLFLVTVISALAWARPETYKETEDFQYSRSSSDEGSKSGFYGAQRGNVGGNYERAHNMDSLAQHQMSGAVHQVEGELGDASKNRAGSVYTAANSRGVYGSGRYDLSNLQGRNFGESSSFDSSHSSSAAYNQHSQISDWRSQGQHSTGFNAADQLGQSSLHSGSLHAADSASNINSHRESNSENQYGYSSGYHSQSGFSSQARYQGESDAAYNQRLSNLHLSSGNGAQTGDQIQSRYVVTPVRIYGRPGTQVAIPVFAQAYNTHRASSFDQNAINSEAEVLNNNQQHVSTVPQDNAKHYESSYNYRKAWERRSESNPSDVATVVVVPTVNPYPRNSELYDEGQVASGSNSLQQANSHGFSSGSGYNAQSSFAHSGSTQSHHQSDYRSQQAQLDSNSNAYTSGTHGSLTGASLGTNVDSKPKSYQSSYSYHKSWERQGDPYVIVPGTNGESTSTNTKSGSSSSQHHSSQYRQSNQQHSHGSAYDCDCDEYGNQRAKRSYNQFQYQEDLGQQAQTGWEENLGQQTQQSWGNFQQQTQPDQLEDLGQQTQESWGDLQQQNRPEKLEDLGQQTQQSWGDLQQHGKPEKLEDLGQQTQNWHEFGQQAENQLGQQSQQTWDQNEQHANSQNLEEFSHQDNQQAQQSFDDLENLGQQTQSKWENLDTLGQQTQHVWDQSDNIEQQNKPESVEDLGQQTQNKWDNIENLGQQVQTQWDNTDNVSKNPHSDSINTEQQTQTQIVSLNENEQDKDKTSWNTQHITGHTNSENSHFHHQMHDINWGATGDNVYQTNSYSHQHNYNNFNSYSQSHGVNWQEQVNHNKLPTSSHNPLQSLWDKIDNLEEQTITSSKEKQDSSEGFTGSENFPHSYFAHDSTSQHESKWEQASNTNHHKEYETHYNGYVPSVTLDGTESNKDQTKTDESNTNTTDVLKDKESTNKLKPTNVGRGDIDEEESPIEVIIPKKEDDTQTYSTHINPEKTPEEIEALSLSKGTDENQFKNTDQEDALSVLSISQQQWLEDQKQQVSNNLDKFSSSSTTRKPFVYGSSRNKPELNAYQHDSEQHPFNTQDNHKINKDDEKESVDTFDTKLQELFKDVEQETKNKNLEPVNQNENKHKYGLELEDMSQKTQNQNQQDLESFGNIQHHSQNIDQQSTGQELENFGQQSQDLDQQNLQQFGNWQHQNQQTGQELEDFGQHTQNQQSFELPKQNLHKKNTGQELEEFGQQSQDLSQDNLQQFLNWGNHGQHLTDFGQQTQNKGQESEDFGQQTQGLNQHNTQQFENLDGYSQNHHTGQQLEDFGQQSQNLNQQTSYLDLEHHTQNKEQKNTEQLGHFGQQTQNMGQELEDFGQQTQDLYQQNAQQFENLGGHSQNHHTGQQLEDFGQQSQNFNQQTYLDLEHHNLNKEHKNTELQLEDFGQQSEDLNQQDLQQTDEFEPLSQYPASFNKYDHQGRVNDPKPITQEIEEPIVKKVVSESQNVAKTEIETPPQEPTEKPGFWKSVGSKLSSAKDKVTSWFKRS